MIAGRKQTAPFAVWLVMEIVICLARLVVLAVANRRARAHRPTPTDLHLLLAVAWSGSVGFGAIVSLASGDRVVAMLASLSAAAMVGGICFRNFGAPRLAGTMILLSLGPIVPGAAFGGEPLFYIVYLQVPMYLAAMTAAALPPQPDAGHHHARRAREQPSRPSRRAHRTAQSRGLRRGAQRQSWAPAPNGRSR